MGVKDSVIQTRAFPLLSVSFCVAAKACVFRGLANDQGEGERDEEKVGVRFISFYDCANALSYASTVTRVTIKKMC